MIRRRNAVELGRCFVRGGVVPAWLGAALLVGVSAGCDMEPDARPAAGGSVPVARQAGADDEADARGKAIGRDAWPASWSEPPPTASALGVEQFSESPMLAAQVRAGTLPPVSQRLPEDPVVVEPYASIGRHGGVVRTFDTDIHVFNPPEPLCRMGPQVRRALPNVARRIDFSDDGRTVTVHLRRGIRWSDGHPLTADDYQFWFEHVLMNDELTPVAGPPFENATFRKVDAHTFEYRFESPTPLLREYMAIGHEWGFALPRHFLVDYHADFADPEQLDALVREHGFAGWKPLFDVIISPWSELALDRPVLQPYVRTARTPTVTEYRRNPYYFKVDPAGQQLPYIDRLEVHHVANRDMMAFKASTGQMTFAGRGLRSSDIPLFRRWEQRNDYTTYIWQSVIGADVVLQPNHTHPDPRRRALFQDVRFRRALSLAINREEINQIVYFGHAVPRQNTVLPTSRYFEPAMEQSYAQFDPDEAERLFDAVGLVDRDDDGRREHPDGKPVHLTIEYLDMETPKRIVLELIVAQWRERGLHVNLKPVNASLQATRSSAGLMDMTVWHADRNSDILFPIQPFWYVPMYAGWEMCQWNEWVWWHGSGGERGEEPSPAARDLLHWWQELRTTMDEQRRTELGRRILRSQAEQLWSIGTLGMAPQPLVVSDALKNVPRQGYWGWDSRWSMAYHPETWYLQPDEPDAVARQ
ncbi:MAG: ABC transporter substrate-binding protein [Phycisphaeraceae bacterium]